MFLEKPQALYGSSYHLVTPKIMLLQSNAAVPSKAMSTSKCHLIWKLVIFGCD